MSTPIPSSTEPRRRSQFNLRTAILVFALAEFVLIAGTVCLILIRK